MNGKSGLSISAASYAGPQPPGSYNLAEAALAASRSQPDKPAFRLINPLDPQAPAQSATYGELARRTGHLIAGLNALDLPARSVIAIRQQTGIAYALSFLAITGAGHVALAMSPMLTARETETVSRIANVTAIIRDGSLQAHVLDGVSDLRIEELERKGAASGPAGFADTSAGDPAYLVFTSGTGAAPKGVLHAHRAVFARQPMYRDWYDASDRDVFLHTGAMNWTYSLGTGLLDPLVLGATATFLDRLPEPGMWSSILHATQATILASVPGIYRQMLRVGLSLQRDTPLRHALTAGEALRPALHADWIAATGRPLCEAFGMSEISTYLSTPPQSDWRPGSPGRPQSGRAVAILDAEDTANLTPLPLGETGILAVHRSDPGMMLGYIGDENAGNSAFRGDWFLTSDLAFMDTDGFVHPQGRADDIMNAMGYRVSPAEVEAQLLACPGVIEAAVTSVEPREGVSIIKAFVVADAATVDTGATALLERVAGNLAAYKIPKDLVFVDTLPRTANGKIQRSKLRAL
ncbi:MAG: acyl-CoA synthetase [Rhodobiaceae bacterium]|nr:acyl-CoA synthetase [Rhodobiaceae bacterium]MCC0047905.1 acyl-CoA synthetase [Rhodobiaceae bacterium]